MLTKCWALEYAKDKIRVNCICPGVVDTDMTKPFMKTQEDKEFMNNEHPIGRIGQPEEVGKSNCILPQMMHHGLQVQFYSRWRRIN